MAYLLMLWKRVGQRKRQTPRGEAQRGKYEAAMFHGSRRQVNCGEHDECGDREGWNGERAMRVG
jgi:hypothetical protein